MTKANAEIPIPEKLYFPIREAAELTGIEPHVLRFWEKEFPMLAPVKEGSGHRRYRRKDIELLRQIKHLLYVEGYTIPGARSFLRRSDQAPKTLFPMEEKASRKSEAPPSAEAVLRSVRRGLNEILTLLNQS